MRTILILALLVTSALSHANAQPSSLADPLEQVRSFMEEGRYLAAYRQLEALQARATTFSDTDRIEASVFKLRILQDSWLYDKAAARKLAEELHGSPELVLAEINPVLPHEVRLRYLQLTKSPRTASRFFDRSRRNAAKGIGKLDPDNALAMLERALEAKQLREEKKSERLIRTVLANHPTEHQAYISLFRLLALDDDFSAIEKLGTQLSQTLPEDPYGPLMVGYAAFQDREFDRAELQFNLSLERMPLGLRRDFIDATSFFRESDLEDMLTQARIDSIQLSVNYWTNADPLHLSGANERRIEHLARVAYADLAFRDYYEDVPGWDTDRGQFMVRYGPPRQIVRETYNEGIGRKRECNIEDQMDDGAMREIKGTAVASEGASRSDDRFELWCYEDEEWNFFDPWWTDSFILYSPSAAALSANRRMQDQVIKARDKFYYEPVESDVRVRGARVPLTFVSSRFRPEDPRSGHALDLVITRGVPVPRRPARGALSYPIRVGSFTTSLTAGMAANYAESFSALERSDIFEIAGTLFWTHTHSMALPRADLTLAVEFVTEPKGAVYGKESVSVHPLSKPESGPAISDLLLAWSVEERSGPNLSPNPGPGSLLRHGHHITPAPDSLFIVGAPLYVYFESYDLDVRPDGTSAFEVEAILVPEPDRGGIGGLLESVFGGEKDAAVSVSFDADGPGSTAPYYLLLNTSGLESGDYEIAVRITDTTGDPAGKQPATSSRTITLR